MSQQLSIPKPRIDPKAEAELSKLIAKGFIPSSVTYDPDTKKIYEGKPGDYHPAHDWMIDVEASMQAKTLGASGKVDEAGKLKIFSDDFMSRYETYQRIKRQMEDTYLPYWSIAGAAGDVATHYEAVRRIGDLLPTVTGQMHVMKNYQALNIAREVTSSRFNIEYPRKTSELIKAQIEIADDVVPDITRQAFTLGMAAVKADALRFGVPMRDARESKVDLMAEFMKELPGVMVKAKNDKVLKILNAISTVNDQSDWTALAAGGNYYTNKAAKDIATAERSVEKYGDNIAIVMNENVWQLYEDNTDTESFGVRAGNVSTVNQNMKSGQLVKNPGVRFYLDEGLTDGTYVMVETMSYLTKLQGPTIQTTVRREDTAGQMEERYWFDYNKYIQTEPNAAYKGNGMTS